MKAVRALKGQKRNTIKLNDGQAVEGCSRLQGRVSLGSVRRDQDGRRHQGESQDEAQGEVDEGGAAQQHGQVEHSHQLQHLPALLRALARQQPSTHTRTHSCSLRAPSAAARDQPRRYLCVL